MDWTQGYAAHWRVYEVDAATWADGAIVDGITSVSVERDGSGDAPLLESGSISIDRAVGEDFSERYLRVAMYAEQNGGAERVDVATLLCSSTSGVVDKSFDDVSLEGRSVLYPAETQKVLYGAYAPRGADGAEWAASMLREAINAPVEVVGAFTLETNVVFDVGESYLSCVWKILNAGNFVMQILGNGTVRILAKPSEPTLVLDDAGAQLLHPSISYACDWSEVPNRYTAREGMYMATALNDDNGSITSTISRGYIHDVLDTSPVRVDGESLAQYALRKLEEASIVPDIRTYTREYTPDVYPFSVVRGTLASVNLEGDLRVVTQSLTCDKGIVVQEKAQREVYLWRR